MYEHLLANLAPVGIRRDYLDGREHFVVSAVLIVPGVLSGSHGPVFYPESELRKNPAIWNGIPIVVNHPFLNGEPVSANDPNILRNSGVGVLLNSRFEKGKLIADAWIDRHRSAWIDRRIVQNLERGKPMEVSTGLFSESKQAAEGSSYRGRIYSAIAENIIPDHLALLPDSTGACSLRDGCGLMVHSNNALGGIVSLFS